jgi:transposase
MSTAPSTPRRRRLDRDQRRDILVLRRRGDSYAEIAQFLDITERAVQYTCTTKYATPQHKKAGRPSKLSSEEVEHLLEYIKTSKQTRRMTYQALKDALYPDREEIGPQAIKYALHKRGYFRRIALRKPPISEKNRISRLEWAHEHLHWSEEQWYQVLWTDETWVTAGKHRKTWVTRCAGEELDPTCIVERVQRKSGWMFWGCFAGTTKGPYVFWEKDWGSITAASYQQHTVPVIAGWIQMNSYLFLMQDNAPGHAAQETRQDLLERGVRVIFWPAFSPDLNPIETVWNRMKDYIELHYPEKMSYDALRAAVIEAWHQIGQDLLYDLVKSMPARCAAVIAANGMHIPF